jgi:hypothetical protein
VATVGRGDSGEEKKKEEGKKKERRAEDWRELAERQS